MHLREIQAFEKYFKVKWNPKYPKSVVREVELLLKKKREAHDSRCSLAYHRAWLINKIADPKHYLKPFRPKPIPLPNAPFGLTDIYPDPPRGALDVFIDKKERIEFVRYLYPYELHFVEYYPRIVRYPPHGKKYFLTILFLSIIIF